MKKIGLAFTVIFALTSCKKENYVKSENNIKTDSVTTKTDIIKITDNKKPAELKEVSALKITEELNKNNDTLYITNFFATWCGPCMKEIPEFKEKMKEMEGKPVKFTFVSLDQKTDWSDAVKNFAEENNLSQNVVLLDGSLLPKDFFTKNFKTWTGDTIPFTFMKKGSKTEEIAGSMSKEEISEKINSF